MTKYYADLFVSVKYYVLFHINNMFTVVKELGSKMFRQHPGYYKAVFLKKTQTIIVSFYEYTVYIMFWIMILYDCYYYHCHFVSKYHCFLQCKIRFFLKVIKNPTSKPLRSIEISLYLAFTNEWNVAKKKKKNYLFYLEILFCWRKVN
jgi:hypothetical protein